MTRFNGIRVPPAMPFRAGAPDESEQLDALRQTLAQHLRRLECL